MPLAFWIAVAFLVFVIGDFIFAVLVQRKVRNLIEIHKLELRIAKEKSYKDGFENASKIAINSAYGRVQHCNSRTDYEMIVHNFNPDGCEHCADIREIGQELLKNNES